MKNIFNLSVTILLSISINAQSFSGKHQIKYLEINTTQSDYGVTFVNDDKVVFTTPVNEKSNHSKTDLFIGDVNQDGEISEKQPIKGVAHKRKISKTGITYSDDQKTVYFSAKKYKRRNSKTIEQLFRAEVDSDGNWTNVKKLPFNGKRFSSKQPTLSKDGKKLFFTSDRPGSFGGTDIFVVNIDESGNYSKPTNLGAKINTNGDEVTPFITDENILYFSSNGRPDSVGNLDVYASEIFDNSASEPLHLDSPINSINDDFAYIVNSKNNGGFFSSNRLQGLDNDDIYSFYIKNDKNEKCLQEIAGVVKDNKTEAILRNASIVLLDEEGKEVENIRTDENGAYSLSLDCNHTYTLIASNDNYYNEEHIINTANYKNAPALKANKFLTKKDTKDEVTIDDKNQNKIDDITDETKNKVGEKEKLTEKTELKEEKEVLNVKAIYFNFDKSDIRKDATEELDKLAEMMKENKNIKIEISSYTDSRGSSAYNIKLSNRRANSTVAYLVSKGIDGNRIKGKGYGESRMVNKCVNGVQCSEIAHQKNRRTEFVILNN
jgi:outer membrane protein OmpA-like peptidoglycan-associated protein